MRALGLVVHPTRSLDRVLGALRGWAARKGTEVVALGATADRVELRSGTLDEVEVVVAVGGDGTVLGALREAGPAGVPVLGVSCGSLGALAAVPPDRVEHALDRFCAGEWTARELPALVVAPAEGGDPLLALNDLVVLRAGAGQVGIDVDVGGTAWGRWAGDGVVVATQQGSSAYTLAAGGPVLAPGMSGLVVTPLSPHGGCIPPLVVAEGTQLRLEVLPGHAGARVELDGRRTEPAGLLFDLSLRPGHATLVRLGDEEPFVAGLRRRGIVADSPRMLARERREAMRAR